MHRLPVPGAAGEPRAQHQLSLPGLRGPVVAKLMKLHVVPVTFAAARAFIVLHHRHHGVPAGYLITAGVADANGTLHGVATAGRPVARNYDDGLTIEVNRACTDGAANACSMLYATMWRAAKALGYTGAITYTHQDESGASLRAAGWHMVRELPARPGWDRPSRLAAFRRG